MLYEKLNWFGTNRNSFYMGLATRERTIELSDLIEGTGELKTELTVLPPDCVILDVHDYENSPVSFYHSVHAEISTLQAGNDLFETFELDEIDDLFAGLCKLVFKYDLSGSINVNHYNMLYEKREDWLSERKNVFIGSGKACNVIDIYLSPYNCVAGVQVDFCAYLTKANLSMMLAKSIEIIENYYGKSTT